MIIRWFGTVACLWHPVWPQGLWNDLGLTQMFKGPSPRRWNLLLVTGATNELPRRKLYPYVENLLMSHPSAPSINDLRQRPSEDIHIHPKGQGSMATLHHLWVPQMALPLGNNAWLGKLLGWLLLGCISKVGGTFSWGMIPLANRLMQVLVFTNFSLPHFDFKFNLHWYQG